MTTTETVTIAILAKDKAHCLPIFLSCIYNQTFPKNRTYLYIRTNNNTDRTKEILDAWVEKVQSEYLDIFYDTEETPEPVQDYKPHQWNPLRFAVLGWLRQDSIRWAQKKGSHYFVADCDNFIIPETLSALLQTNLPVVGPLLTTTTTYANFHEKTTPDGYLQPNPEYFFLLYQRFKGLIQVDVIHCTYLIRAEVLSNANYLPDLKGRHEYVIFSEHLRQSGIPQYLDNRKVYGRMTFADTQEQLLDEPWIEEFLLHLK